MTEYRGDGLRAQRIKDARNIEIEDREIQKKKLSDNMEVKQIADKFSATYDAVAGEISAATVSWEDFNRVGAWLGYIYLLGFY